MLNGRMDVLRKEPSAGGVGAAHSEVGCHLLAALVEVDRMASAGSSQVAYPAVLVFRDTVQQQVGRDLLVVLAELEARMCEP